MKYTLTGRTNFELQKLAEFDNHLAVISFEDSESGLKGFIGIHNTNLGPALGGTRFQKYPSQEAALRDVLNLSKAMSYKCAMAGLPFGGGKGVIIETNGLDKKAAFKRYAQIVEELRGLFKTGTDVGIYDEDVRYMSKFTSNMLGVVAADRGTMSTSSTAALGVYYSIRASLQHRYGSDSADGVIIGIRGVGKLGGELARLLYKDGAKLIIADVNHARCEELKAEMPAITLSSPAEIHTLPMQVYSPCALGKDLTLARIKQIQADIIAGGANNQLASDKVGKELHSRGILYAPDYIANGGGLIYVADELEKDGFNPDRVLARTAAIGTTLSKIYADAKKHNRPTSDVASEIALKRMGMKHGK